MSFPYPMVRALNEKLPESSASPRIARNPKTGEAVNLPAKVAIHFKPGKEMRDRVNAVRDQYGITE